MDRCCFVGQAPQSADIDRFEQSFLGRKVHWSVARMTRRYGGGVTEVRNIEEVFASFDERWMPRIVAKVNDYDVRIAKVEGDHAWHVHHDTDEFFLVLEGRFTINLRSGPVVVGPGDVFVVPRGVEHFPQADPGTKILMFEPSGTPTTGDEAVDADHLVTTTGIELP
jgi:mannose-6-phosphate isomerase-like protein (cupin superfamily)